MLKPLHIGPEYQTFYKPGIQVKEMVKKPAKIMSEKMVNAFLINECLLFGPPFGKQAPIKTTI